MGSETIPALLVGRGHLKFREQFLPRTDTERATLRENTLGTQPVPAVAYYFRDTPEVRRIVGIPEESDKS